MPHYRMLIELLGLPQVRVTSHELRSRDDIRLTVESTVGAAVCPECQMVSFSLHDRVPTPTEHFLALRNFLQKLIWAIWVAQRAKFALQERFGQVEPVASQ